METVTHESTGNLIALIADEDTVVGFLLAGIGEIDKLRNSNFMVVENETTPYEIAEKFKVFVKRPEICIILIAQMYANMIRPLIDSHTAIIPAILEIPTKLCSYDPNKDTILSRAKGLFSTEDMR